MYSSGKLPSGLVVLAITYAIARFAWAVRALGDQKVEDMLVRITSAAVIVAMVAHMAMGHSHAEHAHAPAPDEIHGEAEGGVAAPPPDAHEGHDH